MATFVGYQQRAISTIPVCPVVYKPPIDSPKPQCRVEIATDGYESMASWELPSSDEDENPNNSRCPDASEIRRFLKSSIHEREVLLAEINAIESQAQWTVLSTLPPFDLPFEARDHPVLVRKLERFWQKHARAVWERNFWYRYPWRSAVYQQLTQDRSRRQENAQRCFEKTIIVACFNTHGPQFFVALDARREHATWWWYRQPIVDIGRLCDRDGLATTVAYVRSQARERFPSTPRGCFLHSGRHFGDGRRMWAVHNSFQHMTEAIQAVK